MTRRLRLLSALYGALFHAVVAGVVLAVAVAKRVEVPAAFWAAAAPAMMVAGGLVYASLVAGYVARRSVRRNALFYDSLIGMMAEVAVLAVTSVLYAVIVSGGALVDEGPLGYLAAVASAAVVGFLWAAGSFLLQVLVVGNAAGLVGWWTMEKLPGVLARFRRAA